MGSAAEKNLGPMLDEIHEYWFGELTSLTDLPHDKKEIWFQQRDATDTYIREHFGAHIPEAASIDWDIEALSSKQQVALVVLLDQFSRNCFRNSSEAYAYDAKARKVARRLIESKKETFAIIEQMFLAIALEHSENIADQDYSVWLMAGIAVEAAESFPDYARWALDAFILHRDLIRRFGRYPSRNQALGRVSTEEEMAFLTQKGSGNVSNPTEGAALRRT